uniref:PX domain-containing protein n=1 Tax=Lotharella globosa TaxID=91324 RepID=A0A6V3TYL1_9EUKA
MSDAKAESKRKSTREKTEEDIQYEERLESGTEIKSLAIKRVQTARSRSQVVLYQVDVKTGHAEWATFKRFNAFYEFHQQVLSVHSTFRKI